MTMPHETTSRRPVWPVLVVMLLTALAYTRSLGGQLVYDDWLTVERNPALASASALAASFFDPMWDFTGPESTAAVGYWRPLANVALAAGRWIGGGDPWAYHALCVLLHVLATAVAYRLARRLTGDLVVAFFTAAVFGLHPIHVEAVAWISSINEPLCGLFVLLALDAYVAWRDRGSPGTPWSAGAWMALAILSKELAVAVVPLALAIDAGRRLVPGASGPWFPRFARAMTPFALVIAAWYAARTIVFSSPLAGFDRTTTDFGVEATRMVTLRAEILGNSLRLLVWPDPQRVFHPFRPALPMASLAPALFAIAGWIAIVVVLARRRAGVAVAAALFAPLSILPMLGRVGALGLFPLSERYLYVAVLGVGLLASLVAWRALPRALALVLLTSAVLVAGWRTHARTAIWRDDLSLLGAAASEAPESPYAHRALGRAQLEAYRKTQDRDHLVDAHVSFERAQDLGVRAQRGDDSVFAVREDFVQANVGLGWALMYEGEITGYGYDEAETVFKMVTKRYPSSAEAWTGLGVARTVKGDFAAAQEALEQALRIDSRFVEAHSALGQLWRRRGDFEKARDAFEHARRLRPDDVGYHVNLAGTYLELGDEARARAEIARAIELAPDDPRPRFQLGAIEARRGNLDAALEAFNRVLERKNDFGDAWLEKGKVLAAQKQTRGALAAFVMACEFSPRSFSAHYNAGVLTLEAEGLAPAMPYLTRAYELRGADAAGSALRDAVKRLPLTSADTCVTLATADADRGEVDAAMEWIAKALALDARHGKALYLKGGLQKKAGDLPAARDTWIRAVEALPDSLPAHESLATLLVEMGDKARARAYLQKALALAEAGVNRAPEMPTVIASLKSRLAELDSP